jgi:hypothetical protein
MTSLRLWRAAETKTRLGGSWPNNLILLLGGGTDYSPIIAAPYRYYEESEGPQSKLNLRRYWPGFLRI